ncbi:caspase-1-like isoform X2 [Thrips palmi]|uniref:Caspase-1-like isoform X2 n=1 Tax=Thrips palmi TaxID=161013 RepID=A0A6P8Z597_THRPL|nr:caspase-1-like isoform X2 [Thrips palmi]
MCSTETFILNHCPPTTHPHPPPCKVRAIGPAMPYIYSADHICSISDHKAQLHYTAGAGPTSVRSKLFKMAATQEDGIILHLQEPCLGLERRKGCKTDTERLNECFSSLGFKVKKYFNLNVNVIENVLNEVSQEDHLNCDCLAVIVLTHGEEGRLYAQNDSYPQELLWSPFTADRCPTLSGKPKLFFIQACRGHRYDNGVQLPVVKDRVFREANDSDDLGDEPSLFEVETDFLVAFATVYGYVSWKKGGKVSWFIEKLCEELSEERSEHLLTILTYVQLRVAVECYSRTKCEKSNDKKQIPCVTHRLQKLLYF